ncbi:hypothetical protein [Shimazuella kribbensis]|uniref:hypothetical protein n=1 Tax=Shimazuella kribbensis TaxID=139808 RepID=UPI000414D6FA|nr:hypothetical protein [Shimazuella kribbensis]
MDSRYKEISWGEIKKVLGHPYMSGPEDGGVLIYTAGKYELWFLFDCQCADSAELVPKTKLVSMKVEGATK